MTKEFNKGDRVRISTPARPFSYGGFRSATNDLPAKVEEMTVVKVTTSKGSQQLHVQDDERRAASSKFANFKVNVDAFRANGEGWTVEQI